MNVAIVFSVAFLVMYVAYHMTSDSTPFGGEGLFATSTIAILISHIALSIVVIPFVLHTYLRAFLGEYERT
jgi:putative membrane protein